MTHKAVLLLLATAAWALPPLTIAYHRENHAAPLFDACLYPKDFRDRYRLYLKEVKPRALYTLVDGKRSTLSLRLVPFDSDSAIVTALRLGSAQVGILASEEVLAAVMSTGLNVRIIAPLQQGGDLLVFLPGGGEIRTLAERLAVGVQHRPEHARPAQVGGVGRGVRVLVRQEGQR